MTGTLLVLGASADQLFMIETARAMGLHVVAIDRNPDSPGFARANESAVVSTRDVPALVELADSLRAKGHRLLGVTTMGSDIPDVVAALAAHLGTPGPSTESARLATDKYAMKCRFRERGIPIPWFERIERAAELHAAVAARGLPLVLKPLDSSGSRGVFLLEPGCDLDALFARSIAYSRIGACLVEEYLPGPQISTETVLWRGRGVTPGFADRNYELLDRFRPQFMENGGWVPSTLDTAERQAVEDLVVRASLALDITDGVTKGDVVMTDEGPKMIELAARLSGGDFCESLVPLGTGVNYVEAAIRIAIGDTPDLDALTPRFERCVANRYFFVEPGRLRRIGGAESLRGEPWLAKLAFWYAAGDTIPPTRSHAERFGVFVVVGRNRDEVQARIDEVYRRVEIVVDRVAESRGVSAAASGVGAGVAPTA